MSGASSKRGGSLIGLCRLILLAGVLLPGCSEADDEIVLPTSTSSPTSSTTTQVEPTPATTSSAVSEPSVEDEILARYGAFWAARLEANQAPVDPNHPGLREYATGAQLDTVISGVEQNADEGLAVRRPESTDRRSQVRVLAVDGDEASLQECYVDDGVVYRVESGEVVNDDVATHSVDASMVRVDGDWKLASTNLVQRWEGVAGCALDADF